MSDDDLVRYNGENTTADSTNSTPYPASRMAPAIDLVNMAREISQAHTTVTQHTSSKLSVIANQIRLLQEEAQHILQQALQDQELHRAECNFKKQPGKTYHLYRRGDGRPYFSMLSPTEWGGQPPHEFRGSYRLELDMSWTPSEAIHSRDEDGQAILRLLQKKGLD